MVQPTRDVVGDFVHNELVRRTDAMKQLFAEAEADSAEQFGEDLFKQHFLPYFCGELPASRELLQAWLNVAKSPFLPVKLVANGQVVAIVPPLAESNAVRPQMRDVNAPNAGRGKTANDALEHAKKVASANVRGATHGLVGALNARFNSARMNPSQTHREAWVALLTYFGKTIDGKVPQATDQAPQQDDNPFEYD